MNLEEIKKAVLNGEIVHWKSGAYQVVEHFGQFSIKCLLNGHMIGLTHRDGVTMNGKEEDFYIKK